MAYNDKKWYKYTDDDGTVLRVFLSEQKAAFDGFVPVAANETLQPWPKRTKLIRHVGVKAPNGRNRQYPCKDTAGKYKQVGSGGHQIKVSNTVITGCTIVGRTGERGGS